MTKIFFISIVGALLGISCAPPPAAPNTGFASEAPGAAPRSTGLTSAAVLPKNLQATGAFDYYVLTLSWAPEFCHSKPNSPECGRGFGFIVHGLWPQNAGGGYPENCAQQPGPSNPQAMLDLMPDLHLIQHEWLTHGTCTGLAADDYFALIRRIRTSVNIPRDLAAPASQVTMSSADLKQDFEQANPGLNDSEITLSCGGGSYLVAAEVCFTKEGKPMQCGNDVRSHDCNRPAIRIPAVQ